MEKHARTPKYKHENKSHHTPPPETTKTTKQQQQTTIKTATPTTNKTPLPPPATENEDGDVWPGDPPRRQQAHLVTAVTLSEAWLWGAKMERV